jgi:crossover junction endodeoxyribonuclease RuvC
MRILGIDPGSRLTGYGCIEKQGSKLIHIAHGTIKLSNTSGKQDIPLHDRLLILHQKMNDIIQELRPSVLAIENVFFAKNAVSALKLGQARGAALLTAAIHGLEIAEYSPTQVKQAVVGYGQADKDQVAKMIQIILGRIEFKTCDASDALALAISHALFSRNKTKLADSTITSQTRA